MEEEYTKKTIQMEGATIHILRPKLTQEEYERRRAVFMDAARELLIKIEMQKQEKEEEKQAT